jgi:hypothetical protein
MNKKGADYSVLMKILLWIVFIAIALSALYLLLKRGGAI